MSHRLPAQHGHQEPDCNQGVAGSNPAAGTNEINKLCGCRDLFVSRVHAVCTLLKEFRITRSPRSARAMRGTRDSSAPRVGLSIDRGDAALATPLKSSGIALWARVPVCVAGDTCR